MGDTSNMSEQELQFHYFKMHDSDGNNKLDGLELVKSLIHWHDEANHDPKSGRSPPEAKIFKDDELQNMIDPILETMTRIRTGSSTTQSSLQLNRQRPAPLRNDNLRILQSTSIASLVASFRQHNP